MPLVLLLIIIFAIPEDTLECMLGAILGGGYGILMIIAVVAILYGMLQVLFRSLEWKIEWKSIPSWGCGLK